MKLQLKFREGVAAKTLATEEQLEAALEEIARGAKSVGHRHLVELKAENGNTLSIAIGGDETIVIFGCPENDPPYCTLRGSADALEPLFECHSFGEYAIEVPRWFVISAEEGMRAVKAFATNGERPSWGTWMET